MAERAAPCGGNETLATELALGILTGRERAQAFDHLQVCPACRTRVAELGEVVDLLQLVAPEAEPPMGFESGVLRRIAPAPRSRRPWQYIVAAAAAAVLLVVGAGLGHWASRQPDALDEAAMVSTAGERVGRVWRYDGDQSWLFVSIPGWSSRYAEGPPRNPRLRVVLDNGRTLDLDAGALPATRRRLGNQSHGRRRSGSHRLDHR